MNIPGITARGYDPNMKAVPITVSDTPVATKQVDKGLTLAEIIETKPRTKVVREFFRQNLADIKSPEQELFE